MNRETGVWNRAARLSGGYAPVRITLGIPWRLMFSQACHRGHHTACDNLVASPEYLPDDARCVCECHQP